MKILYVNKFHYPRGGSERVYFDTARLLEKNGHSCSFFSMTLPENIPCPQSLFFVSSVDLNRSHSVAETWRTATRILYCTEAAKKIGALVAQERPDIAHLHNIHHQISPSILPVLKKAGIPTVMTLHDSKMVCASYLLFCNGRICEACRGGRYYHCLLKRCIRGSFAKSALGVIEMALHHDILRFYDHVDIFISPSLFLKDKLKETGFRGRMLHLPNFIDTQDMKPCFEATEPSFVYFGRLSEEKGLETLLSASDGSGFVLKLIGDGPLRGRLEAVVKEKKMAHVKFLGHLTGENLYREIRRSLFVILPSECYENNPRCVLEAYALGKPVIGSRLGGIPELIEDGATGFLFSPGDARDLREKIMRLCDDAAQAVLMGRRARRLVEEKYSPESYYRRLLSIYEDLLARRSA